MTIGKRQIMFKMSFSTVAISSKVKLTTNRVFKIILRKDFIEYHKPQKLPKMRYLKWLKGWRGPVKKTHLHETNKK